jgi:hypothetical protein
MFWRQRLRPLWQEYQWPLVAGLALLSLGLGYVGFEKYFIANGQPRPNLDILYLSLQLFVLESGSAPGPMPLELELARLLAPAAAMYTAIQGLSLIFRREIEMFRTRFIRGHVVICGLGRKGFLLTDRFLERGNKVVVIEEDEENSMIESCRELGAIVLIGNATDKEVLRRAGAHRAMHLISVCSNDGINAEVAALGYELAGKGKGRTLSCIAHIFDPQLCSLLREREIATEKADFFRLEFFNIFESGAREMLRLHPAFSRARGAEGAEPSPLIVGMGRFGESLIVLLARKWEDNFNDKGKRLRIAVIDRAAELKIRSLYLRYPGLERRCELAPIEMDINSPEFHLAEFLSIKEGRCKPTIIYVCLDNDSFAISTALALYRRLRHTKIPIIARMAHDAGLSALLGRDRKMGESFNGLHAFGLIDRTCSPELLLCGTHEVLGRAIHNEYVRMLEKKGETSLTNPAMVRWEELSEDFKEANRQQADHIGIKLKAVGCGIAPLTGWDAEPFEFTREEIERLAEMEHQRWNEERRKAGWRLGTERDVENKTTPYLVPWKGLADEIKEYDRNTVRGLPSFLARAGFQIYRVRKGVR